MNRKSSNNSENAEVIEIEVAEEEEDTNDSNNEAEDSTNQIVVLDEIKENDEEDISSTPSIVSELRLKICCLFENLAVNCFTFIALHLVDKFTKERQILWLS